MDTPNLNQQVQDQQELLQRLLRCYRRRIAEPSEQVQKWLEQGILHKGKIRGLSLESLQEQYQLSPIELQHLLNRQFLQTNDGKNYQLHDAVLAEVFAVSGEGSPGWKLAVFSTVSLSLALGAWLWLRPATPMPVSTVVLINSANTNSSLSSADKAQQVQRFLQKALRGEDSVKNNATIIELKAQYEQQKAKEPLEAWYGLALLHELKNEHESAVRAYSEVIKADAQFVLAYCGRGRAYRLLGQYQAALADYDHALILDAKSEMAFWGRAAVYEDSNEAKRAANEYGRALQVNANNEWSWKKRGDVYLAQQDYEKAVRDYSQALQINPNSQWIWAARASAYVFLQKYDLAVADYSRALRLNPQAQYIQQNKEKIEKLIAKGGSLPQKTSFVRPDQTASHSSSRNELVLVAAPIENKAKNEVLYRDELPAVEFNNREIPSTAIADPFASALPQSTEKIDAALMQKAHPELHRFVWLLGKWQGETPGLQEEWKLTGYQLLRSEILADKTETEFISLEYTADLGRVLLRWRWQPESEGQLYQLLTADAQAIVFYQNETPNFPDRIAFQRNNNGGYSVFVQNKSEFPKKQLQWLKNHYQIVHNREAVRAMKPVEKGRL